MSRVKKRTRARNGMLAHLEDELIQQLHSVRPSPCQSRGRGVGRPPKPDLRVGVKKVSMGRTAMEAT